MRVACKILIPMFPGDRERCQQLLATLMPGSKLMKASTKSNPIVSHQRILYQKCLSVSTRVSSAFKICSGISMYHRLIRPKAIIRNDQKAVIMPTSRPTTSPVYTTFHSRSHFSNDQSNTEITKIHQCLLSHSSNRCPLLCYLEIS